MFNFEWLNSAEAKDPEKIDFSQEKKLASKFVETNIKFKETAEDPVDPGIESLIIKVNELPYLYTYRGSCEGHSFNMEDVIKRHPNASRENLRLPPAGKASYFPGYIFINIDDSTKSLEYLDEVRKLIEKYPGAIMRNSKSRNSKNVLVDSGYEISFDDPKSTAHARAGYYDEEKKTAVRTGYMNETEAKEREKTGKLIIKELEALTDKYLGKQS